MALGFGLVIVTATDIDGPSLDDCLQAEIVGVLHHASVEIVIPPETGSDAEDSRFIEKAGVEVIFLKIGFIHVQVAVGHRPDQIFIDVPVDGGRR